jgi:uncharacterized protein YbaP (TraB family)
MFYPSRPSWAAALLIILALCFPVAAAAASGEEGIFFWEVRSDKATVYLLGSMHAATADVYPLDRAIEEAWTKSPALVVEVNLDAVDMNKLQGDLLSRGMYGADQSLQGSVSEETWKLLVSYLDSRGLTPAGFGSMKPWFLSMVLTVTEMARTGYQEQYGIDRHFLDLAAQQSKLVFELESGDFQLELLSGFDDKMQELFLVTTLKEIENFESHMGEIVAAWTSGDAAAIERLITKSSREDKRLAPVLEKLIYQRNETMAVKIAGYLREGKSCFVVVGAAHLVGDRGIVELLGGMDSATWKVTRVKPAGRKTAD